MKFKISVKALILIILLVISSEQVYAVQKSANLKKPGKPAHSSQLRLRSKKPVKPKNIFEQINIYINSNQAQKALNLLNKAALKDPYNPKIFSMSANLFYKNSQYDEAELLARKAISLNTKDTNCYLILGNILTKKYNTSRLYNELPLSDQEISLLNESLRCFNAASEKDPASALPHIGMAKIYYIQNKLILADDELIKAKELANNNPKTLFQVGEAFLYCENYEKAIKYLKKSLAADPKGNFKAHKLLAQIYEKLGSFEDAQKEYSTSLKTSSAVNKKNAAKIIPVSNNVTTQKIPQDFTKGILDADNLLVSDRFSEARDSYLKILEKDQINADAVSGLAELYYEQWLTGYFDTKNYYMDSKYFDSLQPNKLKMPLIKFRLVAEPKMTEQIEDALNKVANNKSDNFYDKFDSARALFILGNYIGSRIKLQEIVITEITDYNRLKMAKSLFYDQNYQEAEDLLKNIKSHDLNSYVKTLQDRIQVRKNQADDIFKAGFALYNNKKYKDAVSKFEEEIKVFPTNKKAHLYYAYTLQKTGNIDKAVDELNLYMNLELMYPSVKPELTANEIQKLIKIWQTPKSRL